MAEENQLLDMKLLQMIWRGDREAKEELVRKYLPMVHGLARHQAREWLDYEDLCQEGAIGLLRAINEYDPGRYAVKFSTFAYICILRHVANVVRRAQTKKSRLFNAAISLQAQLAHDENRTFLDSLIAKEADPLETVLAGWAEERLYAVLSAHLSAVEYAVVHLILQGLSTGEIQAELALGAKAIDNARTRARMKLLRLIRQYGSLLHPDLPLSPRKRLDLAMAVRVG